MKIKKTLEGTRFADRKGRTGTITLDMFGTCCGKLDGEGDKLSHFYVTDVLYFPNDPMGYNQKCFNS